MIINDEQFEGRMQIVEVEVSQMMAKQLRARDTAQREALARVEAERDQYARVASEGLAICQQCAADRDTAQAQLAEAVGLLRAIDAWLPGQALAVWCTRRDAFLAQAEQQEAHEFGPLKGEFAEVAEQAFREQYGLQEAQGAQAGDELDAIAEAIFNADKDNWYSAGPYTQLHTNDKARLRAMARAALATKPAAGEPVAWMTWPLRGFAAGKPMICNPNEPRNPELWQKPFPVFAEASAATPVAAGEPVAIANRGKGAFWVRWTDAAEGLYGPGIKLYAAPPAAAHGDEAVRKDAERYRWLTEDLQDSQSRIARNVILQRMPVMSYSAASTDIDAAMRAQGDGGGA